MEINVFIIYNTFFNINKAFTRLTTVQNNSLRTDKSRKSRDECIYLKMLNSINLLFMSYRCYKFINYFHVYFQNERTPLKSSPYSLSPLSVSSQRLLRSPHKATRKISRIPFKVLDAPELQDDFYLNLVDWSIQNVLSVGLGSCVYLWSACTSQVRLKYECFCILLKMPI